MKSIHAVILILLLCTTLDCKSQNVIGGSTGVLHDSIGKDSVNFSVAVDGCASWLNGFNESYCGIGIVGIETAWTGNGDSPSSITYTFSKPVYSIQLVFVGAGVSGTEGVQEEFEFEISKGDPTVSVNPGSCAEWKVKGSRLISPSSVGAFAAVITISSEKPFTSLKIITEDKKSRTGGTQVALMKYGMKAVKREPASTPFVVKPE